MSDGEKKLKYGAFQRRQEAMFRKNRIALIKEKKKVENRYVITAETELSKSEYNAKTMNFQHFKEYLKVKTQANNVLRQFYHQELHRTLKWRAVSSFFHLCKTYHASWDVFVLLIIYYGIGGVRKTE